VKICGGAFVLLGLTIPELIMFTIVIIISLVIHELSHGLISYLQGDNTAKDQGRLTLNPINHIDPFGLIAIYLVHFGWAKPVPINSSYYKNRRLGIILTSLAGPLSNILLAFLGALIGIKLNSQSPILNYFFTNLIQINVTLGILNLIPLPPLDGSKILGELFGGVVREFMYKIDRIGMLIIFLLLYINSINSALFNLIYIVMNEIIRIASFIV
jgi:Zn-dependent protease